ncbi:MAG: AAA family ATPase [Candidatus Micrarchaeota archaeon]|nr:AAA family ATPase [Candidatus Micrarchaeota archaeon]
MFYIKGLKFRGFKSFRKAEVNFPKGYVCLAGPNGSGKSNVADGIRFALGEASLKALRAKKISELINTGCKFAEVTLYIDGERQYEIKRAINAEGKTLYKINGKRSTRTLVMDELRQYGLEAGSHNIIAQGQVQRIIEMSPKERRQIIDQVAGIAEFEAKKEEALRELEKVEQKITEAKIVLGEREAALAELEKDKNDALAYLSAKESFSRAQASLASMEHSRLNKHHTELVKRQAEISKEKEELEKQSAVLQARISELDLQKKQIVQKIGSSESREAFLREIEAIKIRLSTDAATLAQKRKEAERLDASAVSMKAQADSLKKAQQETQSEIDSISAELSSIAMKIQDFEKKEGVAQFSDGFSSKLELCSQKIMSAKERLASLDASAQNCRRMQQMRRQEAERLQASLSSAQEKEFQAEKEALLSEIKSLDSQLESLFIREKEINRMLPELDKRLISLKEKAAALRASLSPSALSMALRAVEEMRSEGMKGIFGTVSSLISCDQKYSQAVEASAGQRLNYVVVDTMDTAVKAISKLKERKAGRCTFIPLDTVRQPEEERASLPGCLGQIIDFIEFDKALLPAMQYVFAGTYLFGSVQAARKAGIGKARMVSLDGELIEKSGVISGGAQKGSMLSKSSLDKAEMEAEQVKQERERLYSQLYSLRNEMSEKRKEKAAAEIRLKSIEIESSAAAEKEEMRKKAQQAIAEISASLASLAKEEEELSKEKELLSSQLSMLAKEYEALKRQQHEAAEKEKQEGAESKRKLLQMHSHRSSLEERMSAKRQELARLEAELAQKQKELSENEKMRQECRKEIASLEAAIKEGSQIQAEKEKKLSEASAASQKLLGKLNELEAQIGEIAAQAGKLRAEQERRSRELSDLEVKRQVAEQRLVDLKATLEQYAGVPIIDASKSELEEISSKSKAAMDSLGNVNLRAPEIYEEKKKDIEDLKARVGALDSEKGAVLSMIDEIEGKKRAIFMATFTSVNENFKKLFGYVFRGEGTLLLEQPSNPFESGLLVKVRDEGHDKYLDSMSGGEKSLLAIIFIFSIQMHKSAPFYILDEADAALDKENSRKLAELIRQMSAKTQFIVVTHNDTVLSSADVALGVAKTEEGSKIVGVQLTSKAAVARPKKA